MNTILKNISLLILISTITVLFGCSGGGGGDDNPAQSSTSNNLARFYFDCDLQGLTGEMTMDIEIVSDTGVTWGSGPNPDIDGVIGTGDYIIYTAGDIISPTSYYVFTGENQYADFLDVNTNESFLVQWVEVANGLNMIVDPFGPSPTEYYCEGTGSELL